jgi:hypothetical protein
MHTGYGNGPQPRQAMLYYSGWVGLPRSSLRSESASHTSACGGTAPAAQARSAPPITTSGAFGNCRGGCRYLLIADVHTESRVLPAAVLCAQGQPWERIDFQALLATGPPAEVAAWHTFDVTPGAAPPDGLYLWLRVDVTAESQIDCMQTVTSWPLMFVPFRSMVPQEPSPVCTTADGPMRVYIGVSDTASFAPSYTFGVATRCALENRVTLYRLDYLCLYGHALRFPRLPWRTPGAALIPPLFCA